MRVWGTFSAQTARVGEGGAVASAAGAWLSVYG